MVSAAPYSSITVRTFTGSDSLKAGKTISETPEISEFVTELSVLAAMDSSVLVTAELLMTSLLSVPEPSLLEVLNGIYRSKI